MKNFPYLYVTISVFLICCLSVNSIAQTFTMGKKCREQLVVANDFLYANQFQEALDAFDAMAGSCKTKDGKEAVSAGRAEALNGAGRYDEAIEACDAALKASKNKSLNAHFQKAVALNKSGRIEESKASLEQVMQLTEMNQNTAERANNYALMAAVYDRQLHDRDSAMLYMNQAIALNPDAANFYIQKGDMYVASNQYDLALPLYDEAMAHGMEPLDVYIIKSEAGLKMLENKYGTTKAQELRGKMTEAEKTMVCSDLKKALELGWSDMNKDMFAALVCN